MARRPRRGLVAGSLPDAVAAIRVRHATSGGLLHQEADGTDVAPLRAQRCNQSVQAVSAASNPQRMGWRKMKGPLRGILAGLGAWKLGGGCFSTIVVFVILYWLLGQANC